MVALLDISVLVALFEPDHVNHQITHDWFEDQRSDGWATCPLTENGLVRITTTPSFFDPPHRPADVLQRLQKFRTDRYHQFWPDSLSLTDTSVYEASLIRGPKQLTDIYLLGLATTMRGAFATLDLSVPLNAVKGATAANLIVISAGPEAPTSEDS